MSSANNSKSEEQYGLQTQIFGKLCEWYKVRKKRGSIEFTFDNGIFRRSTKDEGFGLENLEQTYIDRELEKIKKSAKIESIGDNKFRLTESGKRYYEMIGP